MRNTIVISLIVILFFFCIKCAPAQNNSWADLMEEINTLYQQNNITEAIDYAKKAIETAKNEFGPNSKETALSLNTISYLYFKQGNYKEAEKSCKESLLIVEKISADSEETAAALNNLAEIYVYLKKYNDAESLYKRSLGIIEKRLGPNDPYVGMILESMAELYEKMGRIQEAKVIMERVQQISETESIQ